ncbi:HAD family hydrolase [Streptomyces sp. NPDC087525]|uniref:HAD family hydrolase n=1 Tax=Streptomyces sp. NPDC087525 TaxID=3365793 RepID=UPI0037FD8F3E
METIVFDVGETLVRDDRYWASWADWLGIPRHTISALVGAATVQNRDHTDALRLIKPGMDVGEAYRAREAAGRGDHLDESDLYPDVRPALASLRALGVRVVLAGNQTVRTGELLRGLDLPVDLVATSGEWGAEKPSQEFFAHVIEASGAAPDRTVYVGDHPAYDLFPAREAGLRAAHLRRGPWGYLWADDPEVIEAADWRIDNLTQLTAIAAEQRERADHAERADQADQAAERSERAAERAAERADHQG